MFDIDFLAYDTNNWDEDTKLNKVKALRKAAVKKGKKCCMNGNGEFNLKEFMTGFGRIVKFFDGDVKRTIDTAQGKLEISEYFKYADWIYEGQVKGGYDKFNGFGRFAMNSRIKEIAVGWWSAFRKMNGKGVSYKGEIQ